MCKLSWMPTRLLTVPTNLSSQQQSRQALLKSLGMVCIVYWRLCSDKLCIVTGFGGLVLIGESALFREEGLFTAYNPLPASSSNDSNKLKSTWTSTSHAHSSFDSTRSIEKARASEQLQVPLNYQSTSKEVEKRSPEASIVDRESEFATCFTASNLNRVQDKPRTETRRRPVKNNYFVRPKTHSPSPELSKKQIPATKILEHSASNVDRFKSRLMAVRSEGLSAKETMLKCAGIADDAFRLAVKQLQGMCDIHLSSIRCLLQRMNLLRHISWQKWLRVPVQHLFLPPWIRS